MVQELRKWYTWDEVAAMFIAIWNGLETAKGVAQENTNANPIS